MLWYQTQITMVWSYQSSGKVEKWKTIWKYSNSLSRANDEIEHVTGTHSWTKPTLPKWITHWVCWLHQVHWNIIYSLWYLFWSQHIQSTISKTRRLVGFLFGKYYHYADTNVLKKIYVLATCLPTSRVSWSNLGPLKQPKIAKLLRVCKICWQGVFKVLGYWIWVIKCQIKILTPTDLNESWFLHSVSWDINPCNLQEDS